MKKLIILSLVILLSGCGSWKLSLLEERIQYNLKLKVHCEELNLDYVVNRNGYLMCKNSIDAEKDKDCF